MIDVDPCLFISDKAICVTCVDDCIMVARDLADINEMMDKLRARKMDFEEEEGLNGSITDESNHEELDFKVEDSEKAL